MNEPRWIPVTERLPEPGLRVLAYYRILDADGTPAFAGYDGNGGCIAQDYLSRLGDADDPMEWAMRASDPEQWPAGYVTTPYSHWMLLPAAPSDGQSESARQCKLVLLTDEELKAIEASKNFWCHECETDLAQDDDYRWAEALRLLIDRLG